MSKDKRKDKKAETQEIEQVNSKDLIPPVKPTEPTEADVDFANEEAKLDAQLKALKEKRTALNKRKRQAVGGKKLVKKRAFAADTMDWLDKAAAKYVASVERANVAVAGLQEYEETLQLPEAKCEGESYTERLGIYQVASEGIAAILRDGCLA